MYYFKKFYFFLFFFLFGCVTLDETVNINSNLYLNENEIINFENEKMSFVFYDSNYLLENSNFFDSVFFIDVFVFDLTMKNSKLYNNIHTEKIAFFGEERDMVDLFSLNNKKNIIFIFFNNQNFNPINQKMKNQRFLNKIQEKNHICDDFKFNFYEYDEGIFAFFNNSYIIGEKEETLNLICNLIKTENEKVNEKIIIKIKNANSYLIEENTDSFFYLVDEEKINLFLEIKIPKNKCEEYSNIFLKEKNIFCGQNINDSEFFNYIIKKFIQIEQENLNYFENKKMMEIVEEMVFLFKREVNSCEKEEDILLNIRCNEEKIIINIITEKETIENYFDKKTELLIMIELLKETIENI